MDASFHSALDANGSITNGGWASQQQLERGEIVLVYSYKISFFFLDKIFLILEWNMFWATMKILLALAEDVDFLVLEGTSLPINSNVEHYPFECQCHRQSSQLLITIIKG